MTRTGRSSVIAAVIVSCAAVLPANADEPPREGPRWRSRPLAIGGGLGWGYGPFATDSGPWVDAFLVGEARFVRVAYVRLEPGFTAGWTSASQQLNLGDRGTKNDEKFRAYGFLARAMLGVDAATWLTFRAGAIGGYLAGHYESTVCASESYGRGQYGLTTQAALRGGDEHRLEIAVQAEFLAKFANPRCRPRPDESLPLDVRFTSPHIIETEPSHGALGFFGLRASYLF